MVQICSNFIDVGTGTVFGLYNVYINAPIITVFFLVLILELDAKLSVMKF